MSRPTGRCAELLGARPRRSWRRCEGGHRSCLRRWGQRRRRGIGGPPTSETEEKVLAASDDGNATDEEALRLGPGRGQAAAIRSRATPSKGKKMKKLVPTPTLLRTLTTPRCLAMISFVTQSPRPVPRLPLVE